MTDLLAELRFKWKQALSSNPGGHEWRALVLTASSPVRLLAGIRDRDNHISVLVETSLEHVPRHRVRLQAEGISLLDQRVYDEGILRLAVTLERPDLHDIFEILAVDLITVASAFSSPEQCIAQIVRRLEAWQACLRTRQRGLSKDEQAGLTGELIVALLAGEEIGLPQALDAWSGPLDTIHDFEHGGTAVEVKTTIGISRHILISRLDQLNSHGLTALLLVRVRLQESPEGRTLPEQITGLRTILSERFPNGLAGFEEKLMRAGYLDADADLYGGTRTVVQEIQSFRVADNFPRLARDTLPPAIIEASYTLDETQLGAYRLNEHDFRTALRRMSASV
jgi:Putative  PD-(D/E)XK family member, (DUF4420)